MDPIILMTPDQLRVIIDEAIAPIQKQLDQLISGKIRSRMLSTIEAGLLVGRSKETISRWCRGIQVSGELVRLKSHRQPSGKYMIDENDLIAFTTQVTQHYQTEEPAPEPSWSLTKQRRRREND